MANYSISTGLDELPPTDNPELFGLLLPVYSAINMVIQSSDIRAGIAPVDASEYSTQTDSANILSANTNKIYRKAGEAISAGMTVELRVVVGEVLAFKGTTGNVIGFTMADIALGEYGIVYLFGLHPLGGITAGKLYCAHHNVPGMFEPVSGIVSGNTYQPLGRGIGDVGIFFNPMLGTLVKS